jgi:phage gp36-like protein
MEEILRAVGLTQNTILRMNNYLQRRYETDLKLLEDILKTRVCIIAGHTVTNTGALITNAILQSPS